MLITDEALEHDKLWMWNAMRAGTDPFVIDYVRVYQLSGADPER